MAAIFKEGVILWVHCESCTRLFDFVSAMEFYGVFVLSQPQNMLGECLVVHASFVALDSHSEVNESGQIRGQVFIISFISCLSVFVSAEDFLPQNYCFFPVPFTPPPNFNLSQHTFPSFRSCQDHNPALFIQLPHQLSQQHITISCSV